MMKSDVNSPTKPVCINEREAAYAKGDSLKQQIIAENKYVY